MGNHWNHFSSVLEQEKYSSFFTCIKYSHGSISKNYHESKRNNENQNYEGGCKDNESKTKYMWLYQTQKFLKGKEMINRLKRPPTEWEKLFET